MYYEPNLPDESMCSLQNLWLADIDCAWKIFSHVSAMFRARLLRPSRQVSATLPNSGVLNILSSLDESPRVAGTKYTDSMQMGTSVTRIDRALEDLRESVLEPGIIGSWMESPNGQRQIDRESAAPIFQMRNRLEVLLDSSVFRRIVSTVRNCGSGSSHQPQGIQSSTPGTGAGPSGNSTVLDVYYFIDFLIRNGLVVQDAEVLFHFGCNESTSTIGNSNFKNSNFVFKGTSKLELPFTISALDVLDAVRQVVF